MVWDWSAAWKAISFAAAASVFDGWFLTAAEQGAAAAVFALEARSKPALVVAEGCWKSPKCAGERVVVVIVFAADVAS